MIVPPRTLLTTTFVVTAALALVGCGSRQEGDGGVLFATTTPADEARTEAAAAAQSRAAEAAESRALADDEAGRRVEILPHTSSLQMSTVAPESSAPQAPPTVTVTEAPSSGPPTDANGNELVERPAAPMGTAGEGQVVPINEIDGHFTAECAGGEVQISGIDNTITITGHCSKLTVSGVDNVIVIDSFDELDLSGVRNHITYHEGEYTEEPGGIECVVVKG